MCKSCYEGYGSPVVRNEKVTKAVELIEDIYSQENCGAGGLAHIVVDDWNLDDSSINFCLGECARDIVNERVGRDGRLACIGLLNQFKSMTIEERCTALAIYDGFISPR